VSFGRFLNAFYPFKGKLQITNPKLQKKEAPFGRFQNACGDSTVRTGALFWSLENYLPGTLFL
jgi:hypothetical protein